MTDRRSDRQRQPSELAAVSVETTDLIDASADPGGVWERITPILAADPTIEGRPGSMEKLVALAASSRALSTTLAANPHLLEGTRDSDSISLRVRAALIDIAGDELSGRCSLAEAASRYSTAIDTVVGEALSAARDSVREKHGFIDDLPFAVIAMGKWGARELNYYSDIDLVFVHEPLSEHAAESRPAALGLASRLISILSAPTFDGAALQVDADLRPEGTMGPLSRSLDGYNTYYKRWGEAWELQALLKARPAAGDMELGRRFREMADRIIWEEGLDVESLRSIRLLKAQAEESAPSSDIKRSRGGIRDIEFAVQLLQLVHGRFDRDLRVTATLDAIAALGSHGYVEAQEAERLAEAYVFLRNLEHRIQLWDLQQTHQLPTSIEARERIGRSLGFSADPEGGLLDRLGEVKQEARDLHERLYFRPILDSLVGLPSARLDPAAAAVRLEALGFRDVIAATRAFEDLTAGLSRRSRVMHQALPLMLDWLSQSPDPDLGLSQLRLLLAHTPDHGALVTLLQNNPVAGERLCLLLGTGRLLGDLIDRIPEFVPRLADDVLLGDIRGRRAATERLIGLLDSRPDPEARIGTIRRFVRRRKLRIAARDVLGEVPVESTIRALSNSADAAIGGSLHMLTAGDLEGFGIIAMGKWGGREMSYESDVDLMYVFADDADRDHSLQLATDLSRVLSEPNRHGDAYKLDTDLRPEGRKGPLARSQESYHRYYEEWVEPWEMLALVRARPALGDPGLLERFAALIEPVIWRDHLPNRVFREIRSIKARVESERIPPGEDPDFHLKLGPGGLSDVEFVTQLLQLRHGGAVPELRVTGTFVALDRLHEAGLLTAADFNTLRDAYLFCTRVRLRLHLQRGGATDSLPTDPGALARLAVSLGFDRTSELREQYRRHTRRARRSFERLFYE